MNQYPNIQRIRGTGLWMANRNNNSKWQSDGRRFNPGSFSEAGNNVLIQQRETKNAYISISGSEAQRP